ncbi:hypothetical protein [Chryseobacterium herbae]|uniref:Uncharacterized protein n=1 Tax=Chryseobacterium herbae TaxID=2976476 RepID=A0ABT2IPK9_9FLAO|nr:hypothetical protein [Chryseobacterium sp. pc1-10]MCT2560746.1 hypothetical protein [Chryseobacterium sp. pc1-10]
MFPFLLGLNDGTKIVGSERVDVAQSMNDVTRSWMEMGKGDLKAFPAGS